MSLDPVSIAGGQRAEHLRISGVDYSCLKVQLPQAPEP
jgi:hypothetical protein